MKYGLLNIRVAHGPQSLGKSHGEPQVTFTKPLLQCV